MTTRNSSVAARATEIDIHSDDVFRLLVDKVTDYGILILDPRGFITSWNIGAERLKGYTREEILGKHFSIFYTPPDLAIDKPAQELKIASATGRYEEEGWRVRKDGSRFWANVLITCIRDEKNRLIGFGKITRDLTERRQAELRYRLLVEGVLDYAIFSMDSTGHITSWNTGAERIKGYKAQEIIGKHFSAFYTPEDREKNLPGFVLRTATEQGHFEGEGWRLRKNGERFWASIVVTALRDEAGNLYGFSKVTRDMSDRKALLDQLQHHSEELELRVREREESNAELEAFAYSVSHDLRAPLRAISGFSDALREDYGERLDDQGREYLQEVSDAVARMNALVQDLLDYGRVSRISLPLESVSLADSVKQAMAQLEARDRAALKVDVPDSLLVQSHPQILTQIALNLLSNAFKFHKDGTAPQVNVSAQQRDGRVRLSVRDNGIGIAPQHQDRIWNVFERLHDRESYPGTGIGLAIVKRAITRMHGSYGVESDVGKGSTFWIELPTATGPASPAKKDHA
jgi:PAS domain S-box-containing protein